MIMTRMAFGKEVTLTFKENRTLPQYLCDLRFLNFKNQGFSKSQIFKMLAKTSLIMTYSRKRINFILKKLKKYGFSHKQVIDMLVRRPEIFNSSWKRTISVFNDLEEHGLFDWEVIKIVYKAPQIINYTSKRTIDLMDWFENNNNIDYIEKPYRLVQSLKKSKERFKILEGFGNGYVLDHNHIFFSEERWNIFVENFYNKAA